MENDSFEHSAQTSIKFRCKKVLSGEAKKNISSPTTIRTMGIDEKGNSENTPAAQTPKKPEWRIKGSADNSMKGEYSGRYICVQRRSPKHEAVEIPEKYKILADLFDGMVCSIRLLGLCKKATTFQNISTQVEILTKRKFLSNHLAQMKYLFPEAIQMEKMLVHDVSSLCMKQDLKITLLHIMECPLDPTKSVYNALCEAFHSKLEDFLNDQPEVADVPEDILPVPFNERNNTMLLNELTERSATILPHESFGSLDSVSTISHIPSSFHKRFSDKVVIPEALKTQLLAIPDSLVSVEPDDEIVAFNRSPLKKDDITSASTINCTHMICPPNYLTGSKFSEGTPTKSSINSDELRTETPALQTPKRALLSPNEKLVIEEGCLVTEAKVANSVRRSLIYSPEKPDGGASKGVKSSCELTTICLSEEEFGGSHATQMHTDYDSSITVTKDQQMRQTGFEKRQEMLASLPNLFNMIRCIFRSTNCAWITKKELLHKIIMIDLEIEDTCEIEEQLGLLEELIPDWIRKRAEITGDFLYSINKTVDPELVRTKLLEAQRGC